MKQRIIVFLILNFLALGLGSLFTSEGVSLSWYQSLNKAPWTPPGWVFGFAWTSIMIFYAIFMAILSGKINKKPIYILYGIQWVLNVLWNPVFFYFHQDLIGLLIISGLTLIITYFIINYFSKMKWGILLIVSYFIWLLIATSLNAYIYMMN